jgi:ADP-heptose:LPS heptosyltransferase
VHTLPAVAALRRRFPDARIDRLVETRLREVLLDNPDESGLIEVGYPRLEATASPVLERESRGSIRKIRASCQAAIA